MHLCLKTSVKNTAMSKYNLLIPAEGVPSHFQKKQMFYTYI